MFARFGFLGEADATTGSNLNPRVWPLDLENGLLILDPQAGCWSSTRPSWEPSWRTRAGLSIPAHRMPPTPTRGPGPAPTQTSHPYPRRLLGESGTV